ncbi:hypothetical protein E4U43_007690 [Claviceps pusilla]|uniref:Uncharacterized protein n=1 Tax=Claviceps pusilla TaxID=123648 RepID=A0A9P7SYW9_9HYPO|nr:hypothetical protein E4U43_007690 [Claviceps pusilla]
MSSAQTAAQAPGKKQQGNDNSNNNNKTDNPIFTCPPPPMPRFAEFHPFPHGALISYFKC